MGRPCGIPSDCHRTVRQLRSYQIELTQTHESLVFNEIPSDKYRDLRSHDFRQHMPYQFATVRTHGRGYRERVSIDIGDRSDDTCKILTTKQVDVYVGNYMAKHYSTSE